MAAGVDYRMDLSSDELLAGDSIEKDILSHDGRNLRETKAAIAKQAIAAKQKQVLDSSDYLSSTVINLRKRKDAAIALNNGLNPNDISVSKIKLLNSEKKSLPSKLVRAKTFVKKSSAIFLDSKRVNKPLPH